MDSPGRREQNKQKTRTAIEEAAARLVDQHGFAHTTVRDIAQAAGVSPLRSRERTHGGPAAAAESTRARDGRSQAPAPGGGQGARGRLCTACPVHPLRSRRRRASYDQSVRRSDPGRLRCPRRSLTVASATHRRLRRER
ncbi:TetR/AcrR family transcriptional regulator [Streptomyces sp. NPDC002535]